MPGNNNGQNYPDKNKRKRHIENTDNESTQFFDIHSDSEDTAQFRAVRRTADSYYAPQQRSYGNEYDGYENDYPPQYENNPQYGEYSRPTRESYYGSDSPINMKQNNTQGVPQRTPAPRQSTSQGQKKRPPQQRPSSQAGARRKQAADAPVKKRPANSSGNGSVPKKKRPPQQSQYYDDSHSSQPVQKKKKKKSRKHSFLFKILITLVILFAVLFGAYSCTALSLINKMNYKESTPHKHSASALSSGNVTSILLIGTDGRTTDERGRSDTMILLSLNSKTDKITLTSFMRDCYVDVPGYGMDKLTHAYSYGGAELLMETIENNFSVRIDDYVSVNFTSFASIVDAVDGVEIEISDAEAQEINNILRNEVNELMGDSADADMLSGGGKIHLNGKQALAYARIRYIGNADFERTERQRTVISRIADKLKSFKPSMITDIANNAIPQVTTNMETSQLYLLSLRLPFVIGYDIQQLQIPAEGTYSGDNVSGAGSVLRVDFDKNYDILRETVFGE